MNVKKRAGIWLDFKEAYLIVLPPEGSDHQPEVHHIPSDIHHETAKGGTRTATPYGPQGFSDDHKILEHRKHAEKAYFEKILAGMTPLHLDEIVIFGPAEAKGQLETTLLETAHHFHVPHINRVVTANYMTVPEMEATVREMFK
jgi:hypothetical protein